MTLSTILALATRQALLDALLLHRGSRSAAAAALGVSLRHFLRLLAEHTTPAELAALATRHAWPSRADLAAHARSARATP